jgi:hypothetical protein
LCASSHYPSSHYIKISEKNFLKEAMAPFFDS